MLHFYKILIHLLISVSPELYFDLLNMVKTPRGQFSLLISISVWLVRMLDDSRCIDIGDRKAQAIVLLVGFPYFVFTSHMFSLI